MSIVFANVGCAFLVMQHLQYFLQHQADDDCTVFAYVCLTAFFGDAACPIVILRNQAHAAFSGG
jgi:hypothetical protein